MRAKHMGLHSAAVVLVLAAAMAPPTARAEDVITLHRLSAALASEAVTEAVASCAKQGYKVSAAILNMDGLTQAVLRGDGATGTSFDAAQDKAYTAIMLGAGRNEDSTGVIAERMGANPNLAGLRSCRTFCCCKAACASRPATSRSAPSASAARPVAILTRLAPRPGSTRSAPASNSDRPAGGGADG